MKKLKSMAILILTISLFFTSCKESKKEEVKQNENKVEVTETNMDKSEELLAVQYQCPMKCEEDKTYNEAGSCPVCKMDLKEVAKDEENHEGHDH